ncbi:MAG: 16S rRNA pseudouridine(516) synthase [Peptococcaceae bacterium]|nr:16S rRNA pseudouridine(516) synthase [Peptococcaceae bacterium]
MRLEKYLHDLGYGSRKEIARLLRQREVVADGVRVKNGAEQVSETSAVSIDGEAVAYEPEVWLMLHKPQGVITATKDRDHETVMALIPERYARMGVVPVGRLDKDTTGLLLLTNDGQTAHRLMSPKGHVTKVYDVGYEGVLVEDAVARCAEGLDLGDFVTAPATLELLEGGHCTLAIREGKYHQVKRMLHALGGVVTALSRRQFGPLALDETLAPGQWRRLNDEEICALKAATRGGQR